VRRLKVRSKIPGYRGKLIDLSAHAVGGVKDKDDVHLFVSQAVEILFQIRAAL
jgi:hypothetical protein